mmetsp:Transcript_31031/g.36552  ORF Transcript_31031/g.36552 Transcript_31031/m.36552 type:complete len:297 (-) Transcript_31031:307-1197(-)
MTGCIRFNDCIPCAPQSPQVIEKIEVEKVAVALYSEGRISKTEMTEVVASDLKFRNETDVVMRNCIVESRAPSSPTTRPRESKSPQVSQKKKRFDNRSSILPSITAKHEHHKKMVCDSLPSKEEKDPITLESLDRNSKDVFAFSIGSTQRTVYYNVDSLVNYMVSTGDFNEPTSRLPLTEKQLEQLDNLAMDMDCELPSVVEARQSRGSEYRAYREQRDLIEGIERCLGEVVASMLDIVSEADSSDPVDLVSKFHDFDHYFTQLNTMDKQMTLCCLKQYKELSLGPKNKRRKDQYG